jgi:hypothetical protein
VSKFKWSILAILLLYSPLYAATTIQGTLSGNTVWNRVNGPYDLVGLVVVPRGSTLTIESGTKIVFEGSAFLDIRGDLNIQGQAVSPVILNLGKDELYNKIFIENGSASIFNAVILGGLFQVRNSNLTIQGSNFTQGGGIYLQGHTTAQIQNNKFYANAVGITSDGLRVQAIIRFNTIVQNTYGLFLKNFKQLQIHDNSIHSNRSYNAVITSTQVPNLSKNYWGTENLSSIETTIKGTARLTPTRSLDGILRIVILKQLPNIPHNRIVAMIHKINAQKQKRKALSYQARMEAIKEESRLALLKQKSFKNNSSPTPAPSLLIPTPSPTPIIPVATLPISSPVQVSSAPAWKNSSTAVVIPLAPAPYHLTPIPNLPPQLGTWIAPETSSPSVASSIPSSSPTVAPASSTTTNIISAPVPNSSSPSTSSSALPPLPPSMSNTTSTSPNNAGTAPSENLPIPSQSGSSNSNNNLNTIPLPPSLESQSDTTTANQSISLPPINDVNAPPPQDLQLPPTSNLGNMSFQSK